MDRVSSRQIARLGRVERRDDDGFFAPRIGDDY